MAVVRALLQVALAAEASSRQPGAEEAVMMGSWSGTC